MSQLISYFSVIEKNQYQICLNKLNINLNVTDIACLSILDGSLGGGEIKEGFLM